MLDQIKNSLFIAAPNTHFKIAVQVLILVITLITVFAQSDAALAGPIWGGSGG
jgi:hypothetical protein